MTKPQKKGPTKAQAKLERRQAAFQPGSGYKRPGSQNLRNQ